MTCDHGIAMDRYCPSCEWNFYDEQAEDYSRQNRRRSRQWVPLIVAAGVVLFALVRLSR